MEKERREALIEQIDLIKSMDSVVASNYLSEQYGKYFSKGLNKGWITRSKLNKRFKKLSYELAKEGFNKVMFETELEDCKAEDVILILELIFNEFYRTKSASRKEDLIEVIRTSDIIQKIKESNIN